MQLAYDINIVSFVALESLEFHNGIPRNSEVFKKKPSNLMIPVYLSEFFDAVRITSNAFSHKLTQKDDWIELLLKYIETRKLSQSIV